jgi:hypothetical protein
VTVDTGAEGVEHDRAGDACVRGDRECVAGVVVEPAQDLDVVAGRERVVGEVGLPAFVGLFGLETDVGRTRSFLRRRDDQTCVGEMSVHGRPRDAYAVVVLEVPGNRVAPGIESLGDECAAEPHDQGDRRRVGCAR